ncbi:MAG TPA: hypothetical protein DCR93_27135 [Cytophagales bacterium]|nr:hypothetical protein [Cytophagales bacterium]
MKIRMKGNSLRLRLQQHEVQQLSEKGTVEEITAFGPLASQKLVYSLRRTSRASQVSASFTQGKITVWVPSALLTQWAVTDLVGFEEWMTLGTDESLRILVEKDFKCVHDRPHEDETQAFDRPEGMPLPVEC